MHAHDPLGANRRATPGADVRWRQVVVVSVVAGGVAGLGSGLPDVARAANRVGTSVSSSRSAVSSLPTRSVASAGSTHYATFAFARGNLEATVSPNCTPVPGDVTIFQEADYLASLGLTGESDVSPGMIQQSANGCTGTNYTLSWDQLAQLHASNDWEVTVRGNALDAAASPAQQYADSCGLLPGVAAEGFPEASSYYACRAG